MEKVTQESKCITPFLRWTGSKRWFTKSYISEFLPSQFGDYHEPFLGAGAVFFHLLNLSLTNRQFYLSDCNTDLVNAYIQIRDNLDGVITQLKEFKNTEEDYYEIRKINYEAPEKKAAKFVYLNRTSFNGIYRVNSNGLSNVPYGHRPNVDFVTEELLLNASRHLQGVDIKAQNFEESLVNIKKGDLVFLDPPYTVAHENNGFIEYNQQLFAWDDQEKLKEYIVYLIDIEAFFILTNASHTSIADLYKGIGTMRKLSRSSQVGGRNKTRGMYNELIISNIRL